MKKIILILLVIAFIASSFGLSVLDDQYLVAYYPMTEQTGNIIPDKKNSDALVGTSNPYIKNASAYTDGSASYYEATNSLQVKKFTDKLSVSFWGKRVATNSVCFMGAFDLGVPIAVWNVQNTSTGNFQMLVISPPSTNNTFGTGSAAYQSANVWRHFVATYDGTLATAGSRIKLYVNGVDISASAAMAGTIPASLNNPANSTYRVGKGTASCFGNSYIKFTRIYNRPLTPTEVKEIYVSEFNKVNQTK